MLRKTHPAWSVFFN